MILQFKKKQKMAFGCSKVWREYYNTQDSLLLSLGRGVGGEEGGKDTPKSDKMAPLRCHSVWQQEETIR